MATWYVDPEGGNDTNNGSSFALRCKSFSAINGSTGPAAGDSVRLMASLAPTSLGNATWTDNSSTVTLASAATLTLDNAETAWTAGANVTSSTNSTYRKQGSNCLSLNTSSSLATGALIAYKAVSGLNLSAYQCISMWMGTAGAALQSMPVLALCSDSAGATPIVTLTPEQYFSTAAPSQPVPVLFENGGANLPSGINSIALYAASGTKPFSGSGTLYIDNIIATLAVGASGHLSHMCCLGKNTAGVEPEWYPIGAIDGTSITLAGANDYGAAGAAPVKKYRGTTATVTTYALFPTRCRMSSSTTAVPKGTGTAGSPISWTGGWDRTAMSSQSGQTWLSGMFYQGTLWNNTNGNNYHAFPDGTVGFCHALTAAIGFTSQAGRYVNILGVTNCGALFTSSGVSAWQYINTFVVDNITFGSVAGTGTYSLLSQGKLKARIRRITGTSGTALQINDSTQDDIHDVWVGSLDNNNVGLGVGSESMVKVRGCTFQNNSSNDVLTTSSSFMAAALLENPTFPSAPVLGVANGGDVTMTSVGGNRWDNRHYRTACTRDVITSTVHGSTAQSIRMTVVDYTRMISSGSGQISPGESFRIGRYAVKSGHTLTASVWVQRSDTTNTGVAVSTRIGGVAGVGDQQVSGVSATNGAWEQLTITATPTADGVVEVWGNFWCNTTASSNGASCYFGDSSASST